ncbi:MAG: cation:proton antiporter [Betaproteobacteria bacterium]|nr:cation:proton antiporter [Betaproteobacteria bacterium]
MHDTANFIQDMAIIMIFAAMMTLLFHRFKQPVVLGYIIAGVIIGPYTPPFSLISGETTIKTLSELGVIFLLFYLGLEFSLKKLARVGRVALFAAIPEICVMIWVGYEIGRFFGWNWMDSIFLGGMLASSSTTIIVKALDELKMKREAFAQIIFGVLIIEDILAIGIIALLSALATTGEVSAGSAFVTIGKLSLFMVVALVAGILIVPRVLNYAARFESDEMIVITVLGFCFGFCMLVIKLDYSIALGAFVIGAVIAESRQLPVVERLMEPIRDLFSAIFFVTIGLLLDPKVLVEYAAPVAVITIATVLVKFFSSCLGALAAGEKARTSMRVGMGLAQIGEFAFIIASLGMTLRVTSDFLFPVAVAVSVVTTLLTPYLIKLADPLSAKVSASMPEIVVRAGQRYHNWLGSLRFTGDSAQIASLIRKIIFQIFINGALVTAVFLAAAYSGKAISHYLMGLGIMNENVQNTLVWASALLISLPFLIAMYRKLEALSMLLVELCLPQSLRRIVAEALPLASILLMLLLLGVISINILPPTPWLLWVLAGGAMVTALGWSWFIKMHSRLQIALIETVSEDHGEHDKKH